MKRAVKTVKGSKRLTALLIVAVTALYLGITAAVAQNSITSNNGAKVAYDPDYLSLGDMYAFTETTYENSNYSLTNTQQTVQLYSSASSSSKSNYTFYQYYGSVTTGNHSNVTNGVEMKEHAYTEYHSGYAKVAAPAAVEGETVPVLTTTDAGVYTLVPGSTGSYRLYVYSESNPNGHVTYELIDSYLKANAYTGAPTQSLTFTRVTGTNYWYAPITVNYLSWSAYHLTAASSAQTSSDSSVSDTNGGMSYTGSQKSNTTLGGDSYYYNVWTATEILYDTLLAIRFDSTVQLAPVTKLADTITINNSAPSMGSLTAVNAFGETVAVGSAATTVHAPIYITATPVSDEYAFSGFGGAEVSLVDAEQGIYKYGFESAETLTGTWAKKEHLPTVRISGSYTGAMDFFAATTATTQIVSGTRGSYTLTVDYTGAADTQSVTYTVTSAGTTIDSGTITENSNTIQVSAQWDAVTVSITATGASGDSYIAKFTVNVSNAGLVDVAQIGTTKYQYIEDALAAATSGQTVTILSSKVSFVASDTVPSAWTADANGDGAPDGYTVKSGVKLVIPYSSTGSTTPKGSSDDYPYALYSELAGISSPPYLATSLDFEYRKLTLPAGKTMYVLGQVNTGGTIYGTGFAGCTLGSATYTYSVLEINGDMEVRSGGIVSSCGYIYGSGTLYARSGAKLYQPLVICDFRGGGYTVGAAGKSEALGTQSGENYVSPFLRYTTQNIQSTVRMDEGALMYGYSDLYAGGGHNRTTGVVVGSSTVAGLIRLNAGATLTATYDKDDVVSSYQYVGRADITIEGGASFGILSLTTSGQTITTDELTFPIPYNYSFHLNGNNSAYTIAYSMVLLPGATLEVGEGATLDVGNASSGFRFMVMDGFNDHTSSGKQDENMTVTYGQRPGSNYPTTADFQAAGRSGTADLIVNGTLNINSGVNFGGVVQAGSDSAKLVMSTGATPSCTVQAGLVGDKRMLYIYHYYFAGATVRTLNAQVVDRGTGVRTNIVSGKTYYGAEGSDVIPDYAYRLYTDSASKTTSETHSESLNATVEGAWYNYTATIHTVNANGDILSTSENYFCHGADVSDYYTDAACTTRAATVTQDNMVLYISQEDAVAKVVWADGTAESYYTSLRNAVQDAVHAGDMAVLLKDITLSTSVAVSGGQDMTVDLGGHTVSYSTTPFINGGTLALNLNGGTITNRVNGSYVSAPAFTNSEGATAVIDLNGGKMLVQAPVGQGTQLNGVVNYGTLSVADTAGGGGVYCYGPLGADENNWKNVTLTTSTPANCTATVKAEIYANTLATAVTYTGIYNTGTIAEISGGTIRSPMYGVYNGSSGDVTYPQAGLGSLARAKSVITTTAQIEKISGGVIQGGWVGLMNNGASIGEITGGTFQSTGTLFAANGDVVYSALYNGFGTVGNVSNASFLSNDAFTLTRYRFTFNDDGSQGSNTTATGTNSAYGIYNYGYVAADTTVGAGYSYFVSTLGDLTNCAIEAMGTELTEGLLSGTYTATGTMNNDNARALMNYGTVGNITGGSIAGNWGISNHNLVYTRNVYDNGNSSTYTKLTATRIVVSESVIGDIRDCDVSAYYHYALYNCGTVGSLCGSSTFTAYAKVTNGNAVYNSSGWYNGTAPYEQITEREAYTNASGATAYRNTRITYNYDGSGTATGLDDAAAVWRAIPLPTIDSITDNVTITTVNKGTSAGLGYGLNNAGRINSIGGGTGTVTIQTYTGDGATVTTSNYGLQNSAYIGSIGDNVTIAASGERALQNSGNRLSQQVNTYTYVTDNAATVKTTDIVYDYCAPAYIGSIGAATIRAGTQYGILNYGWVGSLTGATVTTGTGAYAINNQGDSSYSHGHTLTYTTAAAAPTGYDPANPGYLEEYTRFGAKIGTIADATITAGTSYAITNNGEIGEITGNTTLTSTTSYALSNSDSYQTGHVTKRYNLGQIDQVTAGHYITLQEKTYDYMEGGSNIGEIGENVKITVTGGNYGINNSGKIGAITGVNISAKAYAIQNASAYQDRTAFWYYHGANPLGTTQYIGETNLSYAKIPAFIGTISNVTAEAISTSYAFANFGKVDVIDGCTFTAQTHNALYNGYSNVARYELNLPESTENTPAYLDWVEKNAAGTGYVFRLLDRTESYMIGRIGTITNTKIKSVKIVDQWAAALGNYGFIETIGDGTSIEVEAIGNSYTDHNYALRNFDDVRSSVHVVMTDITDEVSAMTGNSKFYTQYYREYGYEPDEYGTEAVSTIGSITGNVTVQMPGAYGIYNQGKIGMIGNGVKVTAQKSALANSGGYYTAKTTIQIYEGASRLDGSSQLSETNVSYAKAMPQIGVIDGAVIMAAGTTTSDTAISNGGKIGTITNSIVRADCNYALSNTSSITSSYTVNGTDMIGLAPASVMTWNGSKFVADTSNKTEATNTEATINELGSGNEFTAGNNYAVYNSGTGRAIMQITGGIYTAEGTNGYAVYNANTSAPIAISAGDFKGGTNNDTDTLGRAYAIYLPDATARQTYPDGMSLSAPGVTESVTLADGTQAAGYYFITNGEFVAVIVKDGEVSKNYPTLQAAVDEYPTENMDGSTYIRMTADSTEPGFTIDRNVYLDLNGKTVTLTGADDSAGTLSIADDVALYGMDSTGSYTTAPNGKIVGTIAGNGTVAEVYQTAGTEAYDRYTAINSGNEWSFHKFNISVTGYRVVLTPQDGEDSKYINGAVYFVGTFHGDDAVKEALKDKGFKLNETVVSYNGAFDSTFESPQAWSGNLGADNWNEPCAVSAYVSFGADNFYSEERSLTFLRALRDCYDKKLLEVLGEEDDSFEQAREIVDAFMESHSTIQSEWNRLAPG